MSYIVAKLGFPIVFQCELLTSQCELLTFLRFQNVQEKANLHNNRDFIKLYLCTVSILLAFQVTLYLLAAE